MNLTSSMPEWRVCFDIPAYCDALYRESESDALATLRNIYDGWLEFAHIDGTVNDDDLWNDMICECTCWIERFIGESQEEYDNEDMWETACEDETDDYLKSIGWKER